jgi:hypothetical protein
MIELKKDALIKRFGEIVVRTFRGRKWDGKPVPDYTTLVNNSIETKQTTPNSKGPLELRPAVQTLPEVQQLPTTQEFCAIQPPGAQSNIQQISGIEQALGTQGVSTGQLLTDVQPPKMLLPPSQGLSDTRVVPASESQSVSSIQTWQDSSTPTLGERIKNTVTSGEFWTNTAITTGVATVVLASGVAIFSALGRWWNGKKTRRIHAREWNLQQF